MSPVARPAQMTRHQTSKLSEIMYEQWEIRTLAHIYPKEIATYATVLGGTNHTNDLAAPYQTTVHARNVRIARIVPILLSASQFPLDAR